MEKKVYDVNLEERNGKNVMIFPLNSTEYLMDLNSEDQTNLRTVFYEIIKLSFSVIPEFKLVYDTSTYTKQLYIEIATEYIKQLNTEILKIIEMQPSLS